MAKVKKLSIANVDTGELIKITTWLNYNHKLQFFQTDYEKTQTVPDQSMSIDELVSRYNKGLSISGNRNPIFEDENYDALGINPKTLDFAEIEEMKNDVAYRVETIKKALIYQNEERITKQVDEAKKQRDSDLKEWHESFKTLNKNDKNVDNSTK